MKHEFITKWQKQLSESNRSEFELDVYKYLNQQESKAQPEPAKPELNPIERAYEDWVKIRSKNWYEHEWIQKHSETECLSNTGKIYLKYEFGNFKQNPEDWELYTEAEAQPEPAKPEMTYAEKAKYIIDNKLTHKDALVKNCFAYMRIRGITFFFCDENGKDMFTMDFPSLDLSEWIPFQHKFDRNRFEAMFRAVVVGDVYVNAIKATEEILQQLDAYYASKEGGEND